MPTHIISIYFTLLFLALTITAPVHAQDVQVRSQDGLLSVKANNASAMRLADVLSDQLGISVVVTGDTEALVNIDIVEEPLEKALTKLSPNNMLVRAGKESDSEIIEIVLLMGEGSQSSSTDSGQFLPSGSPAEEIPLAANEDSIQPTDGAALRDPNRAQMVRDAASAAANDAGLPAEQQPVDYSADAPMDPATGLPLQPEEQ